MTKGLKAIYATPEYQEVRGRRERWLDDYFHKLSRGVVKLCVERGVQVIVLGQNKGWKDGVNMGREQNRRFGRARLTRLIVPAFGREIMKQACKVNGLGCSARARYTRCELWAGCNGKTKRAEDHTQSSSKSKAFLACVCLLPERRAAEML
ncbi:hypothetical protein AEMCBJ_34320 (plasmid) [Cupriavidus necator]